MTVPEQDLELAVGHLAYIIAMHTSYGRYMSGECLECGHCWPCPTRKRADLIARLLDPTGLTLERWSKYLDSRRSRS